MKRLLLMVVSCCLAHPALAGWACCCYHHVVPWSDGIVGYAREDNVQYAEAHSDGAVISSATAFAQARDRLMQYIKANGLSVESCEWAADMTAYVDHKATGYIVEISGDKPGWIGIACYYRNNEAKFAFETGYDSHNAAQDAAFAAIRNESGSIASGYPMVFQTL